MRGYKPKIIYCPQCKKKIGTYDGQSSINLIMHCKTCKKRIVYYVDTDEIEIKPIPPRNCSSGLTVY